MTCDDVGHIYFPSRHYFPPLESEKDSVLEIEEHRYNLSILSVDHRPPPPPPPPPLFLSSFSLKPITTNLASLNNNRFSGAIPLCLAEVPQLAFLDLSYNNLRGPVPRFPARTFKPC
ncbi:hypothetical protein F0562_030124 [Nyssa sinensis]|uniref:Leucine-rich repeat-containing N-terminal plant-type domain-containing protein n=1 Tax=Nyssa sinensis TaxID=561372 RepID=A0A5J5B1Y7_9ASTE|nr:hypothetical protein F0562_030124 [Nyssa sinensis]